jgi:hypothetical protein
MNLALSALLIILFLLPAFTFRIGVSIPLRRKKTADQKAQDMIIRNVSKALSKLNFTETVFLFSIVPILLHLISLSVLHWAGHPIDYSLLLNIFAGKQNVLADRSNELFNAELISFLRYTVVEAAIAGLIGWIMIMVLGGKRWLLKLLMGNNVWFKLFTGTTLSEDQKKHLANILVEVLIETKESTVIYSGLLKNYEIVDNSDELACVILSGAFRRDLHRAQITSKDLEGSKIVVSNSYDAEYGDMIPIPGHTLTISGKHIINVNVTYMQQVTDPGASKSRLAPIDFAISS